MLQANQKQMLFHLIDKTFFFFILMPDHMVRPSFFYGGDLIQNKHFLSSSLKVAFKAAFMKLIKRLFAIYQMGLVPHLIQANPYPPLMRI